MSETPLRSFLAASSLPNKSPGVPPSSLLSAHSVRFGARYCVKEPELGDLGVEGGVGVGAQMNSTFAGKHAGGAVKLCCL